jgi:ketosteroid isomerase-like protein
LPSKDHDTHGLLVIAGHEESKRGTSSSCTCVPPAIRVAVRIWLAGNTVLVREDTKMRLWVLKSLSAAILVILAGSSTRAAQQPDTKAVAAANHAFVTAMSSRDLKGMEQIWAHQPYVTNVGPRSKVRNTGFDAIDKYWQSVFKYFSNITVTPHDLQIRVNGNTAWVVGMETAQLQPKAGGDPLTFETFVTNIFEKVGGRWLLVSHHAQAIPK